MRTLGILFIFIPLLFSELPAQINFQANYDGRGNHPTTAFELPGGGYFIHGTTEYSSIGPYGLSAVWTDSIGAITSRKTYSTSGGITPTGAIQTTDNGFLLLGNSPDTSTTLSEGQIVKIDGAGNLQWSKTYGGAQADQINAALEVTTGGYLLAGNTQSYGSGTQQAWIIRIDSSGDTLWTLVLGESGVDDALDMLETSEGDYIVAGESVNPSTGDMDGFLAKTDNNGTLEWMKKYGGNSDDGFKKVITAHGSGYTAIGQTKSWGNGEEDIYVIKTDTAGVSLWQRSYGDTGTDRGRDIIRTADGGYMMAANLQLGITWPLFTGLVKISGDGFFLWSKGFNPGSFTQNGAWSVNSTADGGYVLSGYTGTIFFVEILMIKTRPTGSSNAAGCNQSNLNVSGTVAGVSGSWASPQTGHGGIVKISDVTVSNSSEDADALCLSTDRDEIEIKPPGIKISPNPVTDWIFIESEQRLDHAKVLDLNGNVLMDRKDVSEAGLNVATLAPGIYFLEVNQQGNTELQKFIVLAK